MPLRFTRNYPNALDPMDEAHVASPRRVAMSGVEYQSERQFSPQPPDPRLLK